MAWPPAVRMRFPLITLSMTGASLIIYNVPRLCEFFVYDRRDVLGGQWWRLLTAPFVHFSASHLVWNLLVLAAAGCVTELAGYRRFGFVCVLSALVPGLLFLLTNPDLARYGGLSAVATGASAYFCLCRAHQASRDRWLWYALLALVTVKIVVEGASYEPIFARPAGMPFRVLPSAHAVGLAAAAAVFVCWRRVEPANGS